MKLSWKILRIHRTSCHIEHSEVSYLCTIKDFSYSFEMTVSYMAQKGILLSFIGNQKKL